MRNIKILLDNDVDYYGSLELLGDAEMYDETLNDFLAEGEERCNNIEQYCQERRMTDYAIVAHDLKSDSKYLGFKKLGEMAYNHEIAGKTNDIEYIEANKEFLLEEFKRIVEVIKKYLEGN